MLDVLGSHDASHSATFEHPACLPGLQTRPLPPLGDIAPRPARIFDECVCLHCPVQKLSICAAAHGSDLISLGGLRHGVYTKSKMALFDQGEPAEFLHLVTDGFVRLYKTLPDGRRQVVGFALPGDLLGLAVDGRHTYSAEALGGVATCCFSRKAFGALLDAVPSLLRRLHATVSHELSLAQSHMMLLGHYSARQKLAAFLLQMRDRWRAVNGACALVPLPMPRQDIADYLGLTMETVSRTMTLLARQKLIVVVPDGVRILDSDHLAEAAGE